MARVKLLFRCVGEAVCARGLRAVAGLVPFGDVAYDVAREAWDRWERLRDEENMCDALEDAVQSAVEMVSDEASEAAREACVGQPPEIENVSPNT